MMEKLETWLALGPLLFAWAECCFPSRKPATMPPSPTTTPLNPNFTGNVTPPQLEFNCTKDEDYMIACLNGACRAVVVMSNGEQRTPFCRCDEGFTGERCNLLHDFVIGAPVQTANIAVGLLIALLVIVAGLIGLFVFLKHRRRGREIKRQASAHNGGAARTEVMNSQPFVTSPTRYVRDQPRFPCPGGPHSPLSADAPVALTRVEPLTGADNNNPEGLRAAKHPTFASAPIPTPLVSEMAQFRFTENEVG